MTSAREAIRAIGRALEEMDDALEAVKDIKDEYEDDTKRVVTGAITQLRRGDTADAITTLEREFLPKWSDRAECERAYRLTMNLETA